MPISNDNVLIRLQHLARREIAAGWQPPKRANSLDLMVWLSKWCVLSAGFLVRLGGWETERPDAWREVVLTAIPKKSDKVGFRSMRYISLLPVIQKFYIRALQTAVRREREPHETNILGHEPGRSTAGITATLRQVLSKAAEWGVGAFVASADVEGAFDVERVLLQEGVHPESVCSLLRESCDLKGRIILPGAPMSPAFLYVRGARQGSVEGPDMWNQVLDNALKEPAAGWESEANAIERLGMRWKEKSLTIVAGPFTEYKPGDVVEIISNSGRRWVWRVGGHGGTGYVVGQSRLLGGQHVAQNLQSELHVLCEEGIVLRSQTAGREAYCTFCSTCAPAALHGAGEWAYTQSMFPGTAYLAAG